MELNIRRVPVAFKDLYPDATLRNRLHYTFAHQFLPKLAFGDLENFFRLLFLSSVSKDPPDLIDRAWKVFEDLAAPPRDAKERANRSLVIWKIKELDIQFIKTGRNLFGVITMRPPEQPTQAFFVGAAAIPAQQGPDTFFQPAYGRVFTLEARVGGDNSTGVLCEWANERHRINYSIEVRANATAFFHAISAQLAAPLPVTSAPVETPDVTDTTETKDRLRTCPVCARHIHFSGPVHGAEYVMPLTGYPEHLIIRCGSCASELVLKRGDLGRIGPALPVYRSLIAIPLLSVSVTYITLIALIVCGALRVLNTGHWVTVTLLSASFAGVFIDAIFAIVRGLHTGVISAPNLFLFPGDDHFRSREPV